MAQLKYYDKHNQVGFLRKPDESAGFIEIVDFLRGSNLRYALSTNPTIYDSLVNQFWQTATANTIADETLELHATIDTTVYTITEASIRDKLHLEDASGITMLPNSEIFDGMGQMGSKSGGWDQFGSNIATALICLSTGRGARVQWKFQFPLHSCSLAGSTSAMKVSNWGGHLHFREVGE
ncbi:hypothetical protein Tco_0553973 [Tanacetum coccineum]